MASLVDGISGFYAKLAIEGSQIELVSGLRNITIWPGNLTV